MTRSRPLLAALATLLPAGAPLAAPVFRDVTAEAGIDVVQHDLWDPPEQVEMTWMTGGAAVADVDGDGWTDLFVTRLDGPDALYRNLGNGRFEDATAFAGLSGSFRSNAAGFADVDNDGDPDLYVTTVNGPANLLYVNDGTGRFSERAAARGADSAGIAAQRDVFSVAFGDVDNDGWLDIHTDEWFIAAPGFARLLRRHACKQRVTDDQEMKKWPPQGPLQLCNVIEL